MRAIITVTMLAAIVAASPALACGGYGELPCKMGRSEPDLSDPYPVYQEPAPSSGPSGGTYVQSGNIGNYYGEDGSHCVTTKMGSVTNVSCW